MKTAFKTIITITLTVLVYAMSSSAHAGYGVPALDAYWENNDSILTTTTPGDKMVIGTTTVGADAILVVGTIAAFSATCNDNDDSFFTAGNNTIGTSSININSTAGTLAKFINPVIGDGSTISTIVGKNSSANYGVFLYHQNSATQKYAGMNAGGGTGFRIDGVNGGVWVNKTPSSPQTTATRFVVRITDKGTGTVAMKVQLDAENVEGGSMIQFTEFSGVVGSIDVSSDNIVYNSFAGAHYTEVGDINTQKYTVLESTGQPMISHDQLVKTRVSTERKSKRVYGVYLGKIQEVDICQSLGAGHILVANKGENIAINDCLMSSDIAGHAEKQDDNMIHNHTIAKSSVNVTWEAGEESRIIACTIHGG